MKCWKKLSDSAAGERSGPAGAGAIFAICRSLRLTARRRRISTMPCTLRWLPNGQLRIAGAHCGRGQLCSPRIAAGPGSAAARDVGLFSWPRRADAAGGTIERDLLAEAAGGPAGDVARSWRSTARADGDRRGFHAAGVIRSAERMTYTNVNKVLEGDAETRSDTRRWRRISGA